MNVLDETTARLRRGQSPDPTFLAAFLDAGTTRRDRGRA